MKLVLMLLSAGLLFASDDPNQVLNSTLDTYRGLKSYVFEGTTVSETKMGGSNSKSETSFVVAFREPNKFRVEYIYPTAGKWVRVSDGATFWTHRSLTKESKQEPADDDNLRILEGSPVAEVEKIDSEVAHPAIVGSEAVSVGGQSYDCYVVQLEQPKALAATGTKPLPMKLWIDKSRHLVLRQVNASTSGTTENMRTVTITRAEVNQSVPDTLFRYEPSGKK